MLTINKKDQIIKNEQGIASVIVTVMIILIATLIVLAMSQNAMRSQRQALDRQLDSEAYYAAESGINDSVEFIRSNASSSDLPKQKEKCDTNAFGPSSLSKIPQGSVSTDSLVKYTCILYDLIPTTLQYSVSDKSTIIPIQDADGEGVTSLNFEWENKNAVATEFNGCPGAGDISLPESWFDNCDAGILRVEVIDPNVLNRGDLVRNDFVSFIMPTKPGSITTALSINDGDKNKKGVFGYGKCDPARVDGAKCRITIGGIGIQGSSRMYLRIKSIYADSNLIITGKKDSRGHEPVKFLNAQMIIDSTGKASDILKRIQVRVPLLPKYDLPEFAINSTDGICKKMNVYPNYYNNSCD